MEGKDQPQGLQHLSQESRVGLSIPHKDAAWDLAGAVGASGLLREFIRPEDCLRVS